MCIRDRDYEIEAYGQTGTVSSGTAPTAAELDVRAGFFHVDAGYTMTTAWSPRLSAEFDYASGDDDGARYGRFDTLFGMRRADFGPSGIYAAIGRTNMITPAVRLEVTPNPRLDAFAAYRPMWLASKTDSFSTTGVRDASGRSGSFAGHQLEGRVRYWAVPDRIPSMTRMATAGSMSEWPCTTARMPLSRAVSSICFST